MDRNKYQRLSNGNKAIIRNLALCGESLNNISRLTGLGKTTIYYNTKDLKPRQWRRIRLNLSEIRLAS